MSFTSLSNHINLKFSSRNFLKCLLLAPLFSSGLALLISDSVKPTCHDLLEHMPSGTQTGLGVIQTVMRSNYPVSSFQRLTGDFIELAYSLIPVFCNCTIMATQQFNREHATFFLRGMDYLFTHFSSNISIKVLSEMDIQKEINEFIPSLGIFKGAFLNWVSNAMLSKNYGSPDFRMLPSMVLPPAIHPDFLLYFPEFKMKIQGQNILGIKVVPKSLNDAGSVNVVFMVASEHGFVNTLNYNGTLTGTSKPKELSIPVNISTPFGDNLFLFQQNLPQATHSPLIFANMFLLHMVVGFVSLYFLIFERLSTVSNEAKVLALDIQPERHSFNLSDTLAKHLNEFELFVKNAFEMDLSFTLKSLDNRTLEIHFSPEIRDTPISLPILARAFLGSVLKQVTLVEYPDSVVASCPVGVSLILDIDRFAHRLNIWNKQYEDVLKLTQTLKDYQKTLSDIEQEYMDWKESTTRSGRSPNEKLEKKYLDSQKKYREKIQETRGLLDAAKKTIYDDLKSL